MCRFIFLAIIFLLFACGQKATSDVYMAESIADDSEGYAEGSGTSGIEDMLGGLMGGSAGAKSRREESQSAQNTTPAPVRMVNYNGNIRMRSSEPEAVIDTVVEMVKAKGGSVSHRKNGYVSLQIPVAEFKTFFDYVLTLGHVMSKNISANDITDAYTNNAARLHIAENTLARLQKLLAAAKTQQEKITLLKEIQRISDEIEQRKLEEKELLRRAAFSTINLWVSNASTQAVPLRTKIKAFEWFIKLIDTNSNLGKKIKLKVPEDFVEIENTRKKWSAASALNAKFWAFERKNKPQGTAEFWANAMLEFFKYSYSTEFKNEENFYLIRLQNYHTEPQIYYIAVLKNSDKNKLKIAQAYFPNKAAEEKNSEAVLEALKRAK